MSDREKRIEAAAEALPVTSTFFQRRKWAERILDAADRAVMVISLEQHQKAITNVMQLDMLRRCHEDRSEMKQELRKTEAAAQDLADALRELYEEVEMGEAVGTCLPNRAPALRARDLLAAHPDFVSEPAARSSGRGSMSETDRPPEPNPPSSEVS